MLVLKIKEKTGFIFIRNEKTGDILKVSLNKIIGNSASIGIEAGPEYKILRSNLISQDNPNYEPVPSE